jgi:adenosylcobinamide-phosphate synthase
VVARSTAAGLGVLLDQALGEPPASLHPVAHFGQAMGRVERRVYADRRSAGAAYAMTGVGAALAAAAVARSPIVATYLAVAGRSLAEAARSVERALAEGDLTTARSRLPALVGRDPSELDEPGVARAVVESVAENTVDAVVAPVLWAWALGAPGVLAHRAVNTMDAMVGHHGERYERFGWAAARMDDLAAWVPARTTAALVATCRPAAAPAVWRAVRRDAPAHPSPNSGVAEAAFAAALGLQLGGVSRYGDRVEHRPPLGSGRPACTEDIGRAVQLSREVALALAGAALVAGRVRRRRAA